MHPLSFGGDIIDSPGIKGFGLVDMKKEEISSYFKEIFEASDECKYNNCMHIEEPGCAIHPLVESGEIAITRYNSYLSLLEENQESSPYR
jgi:ribosome biogenesis GTPase